MHVVKYIDLVSLAPFSGHPAALCSGVSCVLHIQHRLNNMQHAGLGGSQFLWLPKELWFLILALLRGADYRVNRRPAHAEKEKDMGTRGHACAEGSKTGEALLRPTTRASHRLGQR